MELNNIYCGDAQELLLKLDHEPDLIIMSPPDLAETNYTLDEYKAFIKNIYGIATKKLKKNGVIASITTDRKIKGKIYTKHTDIIDAVNLDLFDYKIWAKSLKTNLFILNYCHMLFFRDKKSKNKRMPEFLPDVWLLELDKLDWYPSKDGFPTELVSRIILNFTDPNDLVLDPFIGSGKTAKACIAHSRNYIGFDLNPDIVDLAKQHL